MNWILILLTTYTFLSQSFQQTTTLCYSNGFHKSASVNMNDEAQQVKPNHTIITTTKTVHTTKTWFYHQTFPKPSQNGLGSNKTENSNKNDTYINIPEIPQSQSEVNQANKNTSFNNGASESGKQPSKIALQVSVGSNVQINNRDNEAEGTSPIGAPQQANPVKVDLTTTQVSSSTNSKPESEQEIIINIVRSSVENPSNETIAETETESSVVKNQNITVEAGQNVTVDVFASGNISIESETLSTENTEVAPLVTEKEIDYIENEMIPEAEVTIVETEGSPVESENEIGNNFNGASSNILGQNGFDSPLNGFEQNNAEIQVGTEAMVESQGVPTNIEVEIPTTEVKGQNLEEATPEEITTISVPIEVNQTESAVEQNNAEAQPVSEVATAYQGPEVEIQVGAELQSTEEAASGQESANTTVIVTTSVINNQPENASEQSSATSQPETEIAIENQVPEAESEAIYTEPETPATEQSTTESNNTISIVIPVVVNQTLNSSKESVNDPQAEVETVAEFQVPEIESSGIYIESETIIVESETSSNTTEASTSSESSQQANRTSNEVESVVGYEASELISINIDNSGPETEVVVVRNENPVNQTQNETQLNNTEVVTETPVETLTEYQVAEIITIEAEIPEGTNEVIVVESQNSNTTEPQAATNRTENTMQENNTGSQSQAETSTEYQVLEVINLENETSSIESEVRGENKTQNATRPSVVVLLTSNSSQQNNTEGSIESKTLPKVINIENEVTSTEANLTNENEPLFPETEIIVINNENEAIVLPVVINVANNTQENISPSLTETEIPTEYQVPQAESQVQIVETEASNTGENTLETQINNTTIRVPVSIEVPESEINIQQENIGNHLDTEAIVESQQSEAQVMIINTESEVTTVESENSAAEGVTSEEIIYNTTVIVPPVEIVNTEEQSTVESQSEIESENPNATVAAVPIPSDLNQTSSTLEQSGVETESELINTETEGISAILIESETAQVEIVTEQPVEVKINNTESSIETLFSEASAENQIEVSSPEGTSILIIDPSNINETNLNNQTSVATGAPNVTIDVNVDVGLYVNFNGSTRVPSDQINVNYNVNSNVQVTVTKGGKAYIVARNFTSA